MVGLGKEVLRLAAAVRGALCRWPGRASRSTGQRCLMASRGASGAGRRRERAGVSSSSSGALNGVADSGCRCSGGRERGWHSVTWPAWTGQRRYARWGLLHDRGKVQLACLVLDHAQARSGDEPMARNGAIMAMPMVSKVRERKREKEGTRVAAL